MNNQVSFPPHCCRHLIIVAAILLPALFASRAYATGMQDIPLAPVPSAPKMTIDGKLDEWKAIPG